MKNFCFENNNNKNSIIDGDDNINSINNKFYGKKSSAFGVESDNNIEDTLKSLSVLRQLTVSSGTNNKKTCKTIANEHDIKHAMLQASQVNLKNSLIHGNNKNQLVNLNFYSSDGKFDQRKNLEKLSLQYVLSKGKFLLSFSCHELRNIFGI